jgi:hypothetical protein
VVALTSSSDDSLDKHRRRRIPLSERFERSVLGEVVISVFVTAVIVTGVVYNLPDSEIRSAAQPVLSPFAGTMSLDTSWAMYAPDPIRRIENLEVHVTMQDGSDRMWSFQKGGRLLGPFSWYHWQKVKEQAIRVPAVRAGLVWWVVHHVTNPREHPVRVRVILKTLTLPPPGQNAPGQRDTSVLDDRQLTG